MDIQPAPTHTTVSSKQHDEAHTRLHKRWLVFVRILCIGLVVYTLGFFGTSFAIAFAQHRAVCTGLTCVLPIPEALVYFTVAALIFWRKSDDWMALLVALMLILITPIATLPDEILTLLGGLPSMRVLLAVSTTSVWHPSCSSGSFFPMVGSCHAGRLGSSLAICSGSPAIASWAFGSTLSSGRVQSGLPFF